MSIMQASRTIVEFNGGDIATGYGIHIEDGIGRLAFQDLEIPQEIGTEVKNSNHIYPVVLLFHKTESIDVVIEQLQKLKEKMKEKNNVRRRKIKNDSRDNILKRKE